MPARLLLTCMQPQKLSCAHCGAEMLPEARFCRRCGQASKEFARGSVTEVTTRRLETDVPHVGNPNLQQSELELSRQGATMSSLGATTKSLAPQSSIRTWLPYLVLLALFLLLIPIVVLLSKQPTVIIKKGTEAPAVPPPPAPPAPGARSSTSIDQTYIYPGARTTMEMTRVGAGSMVQLETNDNLDKVVDWYTTRLKPKRVVRVPEQGQTILDADDLKAIISQSGNGTSILLKQGAD